MEAALLAALEGIQRKLESLETEVLAVQATQAAQGQGLADVRRGLDELRLRGQAQPPQGAPAAAEGAAAAAAAAAALGGQAAEPRSEGAAAAHEAGTPPDEYEMPDDAAGGPAPALGEQPAASGGAPTAARMQHGGGAPQQAGAGVPAAAAPAAAPTGESPGQPRRRLQPQRLQPQQLPPEQQSDEEGGEAAEEPAVGAGQGPFPAVETFRADQVLKLHENFIAAALPRRPPAPYRRRLPPSLWQQARHEVPPEVVAAAAAAAQQQQQQQQGEGRPPGWPGAFMINSPEVCGPCHPSDFAEERRRWPANARANWRELRRRLLGFKRRLRAERGESGSESESEDEAAVAARFGMQKGATFDAEEEEDSELREVLPAWDAAELDAELSFSGSEPSSSEEGEEEEIAQEQEEAEEAAEPEAQGLEGIQAEVTTLAARRQELLGQLVAALGLDDPAAEAEAVAVLQQQMAWRDEARGTGGGSLPQLLLDDPRLVLPSARKAAAALEGLLLALQQQAERWRARKLPELQQDGHRIWREGRMTGRGGASCAEEWRADAALYQERLLKQLLELLKTHLQSRVVSINTVRRAGGIMELSYEHLLERLELLRTAALPEQPAKAAQPPAPAAAAAAARRQQQQQRQQQAGEGGAAAAAAGSGSEAGSGNEQSGEGAEDEYVADSWLVEEDEEGGGGSGADAEMADADEDDDAGYASAAEELPSGSEGAAGAAEGRGGGRRRQPEQQPQEQQPRGPAERPHAWNAAGLLPGETKVLVAPALHTPQRPAAEAGAASPQPPEQQPPEQQQQQRPEEAREQEEQQEEPQPAATEPQPAATEPLPATQVVADGAGEAGQAVSAAADDATSPAVQDGLGTPAAQQSPAPSAGAVDAAMARAGSIMGDSDATDPGLLPPAPEGLRATATSPAEQAAATEGQPEAADGEAQQADGAVAAEEMEEGVEGEEDDDEEEEEATEPMSEDEAAAAGRPGHLARLAVMAPVEVLRTSDERGLHWERAYLQQRIRPDAQSASLSTVAADGELVPFICFALGTLRPAVPLAAPGSPPAVGVPALTRADIRVGRCFELRVSGDRSGQSAAYVPALVVSAGINTKRQRERQRSIAHVLERLHARQAQQAQQPDAAEAGEAAAAGEADAAATAELAYQLAWPGSGGSHRVVVTESELAQDGALLRWVCSWSADTGRWEVVQAPLPHWKELGLSGAEVERLCHAVRTHRRSTDHRVAEAMLRKLRENSERAKALPALQRWFQRHKLARYPSRSWQESLRALKLTGRQADAAAKLADAGADDNNFALHVRNGELLAADPRTNGARFAPRPSPAKKKKLLPEPTPTKAQQRLAARQLGRQALAGSQPDAYELIAQQVVEEAVGEAAEAIAARKLVPLWPDKPLEGQPQVYSKIWQHLKPHQKEGFQFIWNALELDFRQSPDIAAGCILAHHMGLGKTLQTVAFLASYALLHPEERFLVAVPKIVKGNWHAEFLKWLPELPAGSPGLSKKKVMVLADSKEAATVVPQWHRTPSGVLITTHEMFAMLVTGSKRGPRAKGQRSLSASGAQLAQLEAAAQQAQQAQQAEGPSVAEMLRDGPSVVVVDEAHVVKTDTALRSRALVSIKTRRRLALTGYPLQNNLSEMHSMISWADPDLISKKEWDREYAQPIMAGQLPDASAHEVKTMNRRLAVFHDLTSGVVHRCGEEILKGELPPKHEVVLKLALTPTQQKVYERYLQGTAEREARSLFRDRGMLAMLCDRPSEFRDLLKKEVAAGRARAAGAVAGAAAAAAGAEGAQAAGAAAAAAMAAATAAAAAPDEPRPDPGFEMVLDDRSPTTSTGLSDAVAGTSGSVGAVAADGQEGADVEQVEQPSAAGAGAAAAANGPAPAQAGGLGALVALAEAAVGLPADKRRKPLPLALAEELLEIVEAAPPGEFDTPSTSKMWAIRQLLQHCAQQGEKLILVGESLDLLRRIEDMLGESKLQLPGGRPMRWCKIEGDTTDRNRSALVKAFEAGTYQVFLISKAGTHGINLVSCRRIVVLEEFFNPVYNLQAIARLFRYGQTQETFVYRMYHNGSIHYNCYLHNVNKVALFRRVVDRQELKVLRKSGEDEATEKKLSYYLYAPDAPDQQSLKRGREQRADPALAALLAADAEQAAGNGGRLNIVVVEDHDKNLADDPSQRLSKEERRRAAAQERRRLKLQAQQEAAAAAATGAATEGRVMTRSMRAAARLKKRYEELGYEDMSEDEGDLSEGQAPQQGQQAQQAQQAQPPYMAQQVQQQYAVQQRQQQQQQHAPHALRQQHLQFAAPAQQQQQQQRPPQPQPGSLAYIRAQAQPIGQQRQQQQQQQPQQQVHVQQRPPQLSDAEQAEVLQRAAQQAAALQAAQIQQHPTRPLVQVQPQHAQLAPTEQATLLAQLAAQQRADEGQEQAAGQTIVSVVQQPWPLIQQQQQQQQQQQMALMLAQQQGMVQIAAQQQAGLQPALAAQMLLQQQAALQRAASYHGMATASQQARLQGGAGQPAAAAAAGVAGPVQAMQQQQQRQQSASAAMAGAAAAAAAGAAAGLSAAAAAPQAASVAAAAAAACAAAAAAAAGHGQEGGAQAPAGEGTPATRKRPLEEQQDAPDGTPGGQQQKRARAESEGRQAAQQGQGQPVPSGGAAGTLSSGQKTGHGGKRRGLKALMGRLMHTGHKSHSLGSGNATLGSPSSSARHDQRSPGQQQQQPQQPAGQGQQEQPAEQKQEQAQQQQQQQQQHMEEEQPAQQQQQQQQKQVEQAQQRQRQQGAPAAQAMPQEAPQQPPQQAQQLEQAPQQPAAELFGVPPEQQQPSSDRPPSARQEQQHSGSDDSLLGGGGLRRGAKRQRPAGGSNLRPAALPRVSPRRQAPFQAEPEVVDLTQDDD